MRINSTNSYFKAGGITPGKVYGSHEVFVLEPISRPGLIVGMEAVTILDQGHTTTFNALRVHQVRRS